MSKLMDKEPSSKEDFQTVAVTENNLTKIVKEKSNIVFERIIETILKKNADYGDAWQKYGIFTPLIRINDKILRVKTLSDGHDALVAEENIDDTLVDIIAYALLALLRRDLVNVGNIDKKSIYKQLEFNFDGARDKIEDIYRSIVYENKD